MRKTNLQDETFQWDGDGQDPIKRVYYPYDVTVTAKAIHLGEIVEGNAYLGGSYYKPDEPLGNVHGYLPQMIDESIHQLIPKLTDAFTLSDCGNAQSECRETMQREYDRQTRLHAKRLERSARKGEA